jgi:hypothetical protein
MISDEQERLLKFLDHVTFPKAVGEFFRDDPQFTGVVYSAYHPKEPATVPCVLYKLQRRTPGVDGVETRKPRFRYKVVEEDGSITEVYSQWMSCIYQFDICAHSTDEVDDISRNFYAFMRAIVGELQKLGVGDVIFDEELEDQLVRQTRLIRVEECPFYSVDQAQGPISAERRC